MIDRRALLQAAGAGVTLFRRGLVSTVLADALLPTLATARVSQPNSAIKLANPELLGFSSERLRRFDEAMKRVVSDKQYAGVVSLIARHGKVIYFNAVGKSDLESGAPLEKDTIFRIFSMTKLITGVSMMILYEEGKWNPQDRISSVIPEFANLKVYKGNDPQGNMLVEDPIHPPTMRELMTHTAGFSYGYGAGPIDQLYRDSKGNPIFMSSSLQAMIDRLAKIPLLYQPSSRWVYSLSVDIQGYIIEKLSGMSLPRFMQKHVFEPLGMKDTGFSVPQEQWHRLAKLYTMNASNELEHTEPNAAFRYDRDPDLPQGGAGLVSTATDYFRFAQMLLNGGDLDGIRIIGPQTVNLMMSNHLPNNMTTDFQGGGYAFVKPRLGFGYGFDGGVVTDPGEADIPIGKGSYFWDGAAGTWTWIDPTYDIVVVGLVQRMGWGDDFGSPPNLEEISRATIYQALTRPDL